MSSSMLPNVPWRAEHNGMSCSGFVLDAQSLTIAEVHGDSRAQAQDIAATVVLAPEMIETLKEVLGILLDEPDSDRKWEAIRKIRATLGKLPF